MAAAAPTDELKLTPELEALAKAPLYGEVAREVVKPAVDDANAKVVPASDPAIEGGDSPPADEQEKTPAESASGEVSSERHSAAVEGLDPEEINLAKMYGFTEEEIGEFSTSADLARAIAPFERRLMKEKPKAIETQEPVVKTPAVEPPVKKVEAAVADDEDLSLDPAEVDEALASKFNKLAALLKSEQAAAASERTARAKDSEFIQAIVAQQHEVQVQQRIRHFDALVDAVGDAEKYGPDDASKRTVAQFEARSKLWNESHRMLANLNQNGMKAELNKAVLKRAELYAFPEEIQKQATKKVQQALADQSKKRIGRPSSPKALEAPKTDPDKDPESMARLRVMWNQMEQEAGA